MSYRPSSSQHFPPDLALFGFALGAIVLLYFSVSHLTLELLGFNYEASGGNPLEKIHPATLVSVMVLGLAGLTLRNPLIAALQALIAVPGTFFFLVMVFVAIVHSIFITGLPFTGYLDTFIAPVLAYFLFRDLCEDRARRLAILIHALVVLNALIGLGEFATGERLTPLVANGVVITDDWRSTALFGHPLLNASITGVYLLALAAGAGRDLPTIGKPFVFVIASAGMIVFGGRAATILLIGFVLLLMGLRFLSILLGKTFGKMRLVQLLVLVPVAALAVLLLGEYGFFDLFIKRFIDDRGSAQTRIDMFALFQHVTWFDLLTGPDPAQVATLQRLYGLDFGIESFWISLIFKTGMVVAIPFFIGLFAFCRDVVRRTSRGASWVLLFFFGVASASVSLSAKTPLFTMMIVMLLVLFRLPQPSIRAQRKVGQRNASPGFAPAQTLHLRQQINTS